MDFNLLSLARVTQSANRKLNKQFSWIVLSVLLYAFFVVVLYPSAGTIVAVFSILPASAMAIYFGPRAGFVTGLLFLPINWAMLKIMGLPVSFTQFALDASLIGSTMVGSISAGVGYIATINKRLKQEVFERKQMQIALNEVNDKLATQAQYALQARSHFLTAISHKLRTPLNASMGLSTLLLDTNLDGIQSDYVHDILRSNKDIVGIINSILEYTKIESGEIELNSSEFELAQFIEQTKSLSQPRAIEQKVALNISVDPQVPPCLLGDTARLHIILSNLLNNAFDATQEGNEVNVSITPQSLNKQENSTHLCIKVADNGVGMSPTVLDNLFDPFSTAYQSTIQSGRRAGIGMALSKSLCEKMGGTIEVESRLREGTSVTVTLPFALPNVQSTASSTTASSTKAMHRNYIAGSSTERATSQGPMTILLAEDNILNAKVALKMLEKLGHNAEWVKDGQEAVDATANNFYDLILMDIQMPRLDGLQATQKIRMDQSTQDASVIIALTADTTLENFSKQKAYGFDGFISKPVSIAILSKAITPHGIPTQSSSVQTLA